MRTKTIALLLAAVLMTGSCTAALAAESVATEETTVFEGGPRGHRGPGFGHRGGPDFHRGPGRSAGFHKTGLQHRLWEGLELDDAQKARMVDILTNNYREKLTARMEMATARRALRDIRDAENARPEDIVAANEALGAVKGKLEVLNRTLRQEVDEILTPEQKATLEERRDAPRHFRHGRFGNDRDDGPRGRRHDGRGGHHRR